MSTLAALAVTNDIITDFAEYNVERCFAYGEGEYNTLTFTQAKNSARWFDERDNPLDTRLTRVVYDCNTGVEL